MYVVLLIGVAYDGRDLKITLVFTFQRSVILAVTSGDYYMFHDADKPEVLKTDVEEPQQSTEEEESSWTPSVGKV